MTEKRLQRHPNPQGKGLVPVLNDLHPLSANRHVERSPLDVFRDYCLSSLVLAADFKFKPAPHINYYLYSTSQSWNLSLVAPQEWHGKMPGAYVAHCLLKTDLTWQLEFADLESGCEASRKLENFVEGFVENIWAKNDLRASLPVYAEQLPYYHRVLASGLAASLSHTMPRQELLTQLLPQLLQSSERTRLLLHNAENSSEAAD